VLTARPSLVAPSEAADRLEEAIATRIDDGREIPELMLVEGDHFIVTEVLANDSVFAWQRTAT
jgi:hypothetical protein